MSAGPAIGGRPPERGTQLRRRLLLGSMLLVLAVLAVRAFRLEVVEGEIWLARAAEQHVKRLSLPAPRGTIYDRHGVPLAGSRVMYRVAVAPREVRDRDALADRLVQVLGFEARAARRVLDMERRWIVLPGRYDEAARDALDGVAGVHFERVMQRFYPHGGLAMELLGAVSLEGEALGGIELEFDADLTGRSGMATVRRDHLGRPLPGAMLTTVEPVAGRDVYLTIDANLQEIADAALRQAITETRSAGGELILLDPMTGEILAAVSRRGATSRNWRAVTVPYEPGSTIKPFIVAALLAERAATLQDSVYAEQGRYVSGGRTITDVKAHGWLTLSEALRMSSNIALAKLAARLDPAAQYHYLRAFGFGTPTAVQYPSESGGTLRRPAHWSGYSQASLAIGYEIAVTPLQMALAYGALANGGVLMEPRLVREVRSRDGRMERQWAPRPVRRIVSPQLAAELGSVLQSAVDGAGGTGGRAALGPFTVAGKTGTSRVASGHGYKPGAYLSSFAGFFPADDPQLVFFVKLDEPQGAYYGGLTAAPVTRATIEAVLASRQTPLDRSAVATAAVSLAPRASTTVRARAAPDGPGIAAEAHVLTVAARPATGVAATTYASGLNAAPVVPAVIGQPLRDAIRQLHAAGLSVRVEGEGTVRETDPPAGSTARGVIRLIAERGR